MTCDSEELFKMKDLYLLIQNSILLFPAVPSKPIGPIEVTDVQRDSISIKWKAPKDDGGSPITGYIIDKRSSDSTIWSPVDKVDELTLDLCCKYLTENTEYFFRVIAVNSIGQSEPLVTNDKTLAKSPFGKQ